MKHIKLFEEFTSVNEGKDEKVKHVIDHYKQKIKNAEFHKDDEMVAKWKKELKSKLKELDYDYKEDKAVCKILDCE